MRSTPPSSPRDPDNEDAAILFVDSGGNATRRCTCELLPSPGDFDMLLPSPGDFDMLLRMRSGHAVDSALFRRALALFRIEARHLTDLVKACGVRG
ncbi:hypothetical protein [Streptomyces noursei]|uniref:hypothetical protein n=1 Tax=Streptomyces noursei TaxID=1971 RepID=UPI0005C9D528